AIWKRVLRPRTTIYLGSILLIAVAASVSLYLKNPLKVDVIRDRGVLAREVEAGVIENVYRLQIMNTGERAREFVIEAAGLSGLQVVGVAQPVAVQAAATRLVPLRLRASEPARVAASGDDAHEGHADTRRIEITVRASDDTHVARVERSSFVFPR